MVARRSDVPSLNETDACAVAGISPAKRKDWVNRGLLEAPAPGAGFSELQVIEMAILHELHDVVGPKDVDIVWPELRELLSYRVPVGMCHLVIDQDYREVSLVTVAAEIGPAVLTRRWVVAIPLAEVIARVRAAYRRIARAKMTATSKREPRRRRKTG